MDEPSPQPAAQVSTGRRRLKTIILAVTGISVVLIFGALGYLVYNTIKGNNSTFSEESATIIHTAPSHQPSSLSSTSPKTTSTSSLTTVTSKRPSAAAPTDLPSSSTSSTKSILSSTESTESISSSMTVVTTERTSQVNLLTSCESKSSANLTGTSPLDCSSIESCNSGVFYVFPYGESYDSVPVYCECTEDEMWTIIQKRFDGSVDFNRNWTDYKNGYGDACGEYWLGNEALHQLTTNMGYELTIIMSDWNGVTKYAIYETFSLADEANGYQLNLGSYSGNADNSMLIHNGYPFSTGDRDNDDDENMNHAVRYSGPWWYSDGMQSNLNGHYYPSPENPDHDGIIWYTSFGYDSLKGTTMMIKQNNK